MFGGGYAHRGTGITSGLTTPKRGYVDGPGSYAGTFEEYYNLLKGVQGEREPFSKWAAASPALLDLSGALLSGKSYQGGVGGALDILGQGLTASAPGFAKAIEARREHEADIATQDTALRMKALEMSLEEDDEKWTGKEEFQAQIWSEQLGKFEPVNLTRFVSDQGNVMYKDPDGVKIDDFLPVPEKGDLKAYTPANDPLNADKVTMGYQEKDPIHGSVIRNREGVPLEGAWVEFTPDKAKGLQNFGTGLLQLPAKNRTEGNPQGLVEGYLEWDDDKKQFTWKYDNEKGKRVETPSGTREVSIAGDPASFGSEADKARSRVIESEISTRQAIGKIDGMQQMLLNNPDVNTWVASAAGLVNELKAQVGAILKPMGKGEIEDPEVMNIDNPAYTGEWQKFAIESEVAKREMLDLAYVIAAARGQTGKSLSDKDVSRFLKIIGRDRAAGKTIYNILENLKVNLAEEWARENETLAGYFPNIEVRPYDYLLFNPGQYPGSDELTDPMDFGALIDKIEAEAKAKEKK